MTASIWYISKYVTPQYAAKLGARGFHILREFARLGHRAVLITSDSNHLATPPRLRGPRFHENVNGVDVHWLRTRKYRSADSIGRIISWLDFEWRLFRMPHTELPRPEVIIVSSLSLLTILNGLWLRRRYRCKLVFEVRDIWPLTLVGTGGYSPRNPIIMLLAWIEKLGYSRADLIVGTMPNLREHVAEVAGATCPVVCIPQGVSFEAFDNSPEPLTVNYVSTYIPQDKFIICHAGSIGADNALETLLDCAKSLRDRPDIHFLIVGEGYLKATFQEQSRDLTNVTFAPGVPKAVVQSVLARADLLYFAVPRSPVLRFGQSLNKVIDYMLSGKPVVASFTGYPTMINEAECGSYVPAEDPQALRIEFERYASMAESKRNEIGARGRSWLKENRDFEHLARDYLAHLGLSPSEGGFSSEISRQMSRKTRT